MKGYAFVQYALPEDAQQAIVDLKKRKFKNQKVLSMEMARHRHRQGDRNSKEIDQKQENADTTEPLAEISPKVDIDIKQLREKGRQFKVLQRTLLVRNIVVSCTKKQFYKKAKKYGNLKLLSMPRELNLPAKETIEISGQGELISLSVA